MIDPKRYPRQGLAQLPTPFERLNRLAGRLGAGEIWIKRDDLTGLAFGGNKTRKLEFLIADAKRQGATVIVTAGGMQSNHVRQTAAAAAKLGFACEAVVEDLRPEDATYNESGNALLDRLFGAKLRPIEKGGDVEAALGEAEERLKADGEKPYVIPVGGSNPLGALGYAVAGIELAEQMRAVGADRARIYVATGSGGTQAGLLLGLHAAGMTGVTVEGICVSRDGDAQRALVTELMQETARFLKLDPPPADAVRCDGGFVGPGYGEETDEMKSAVHLLAGTEGVLLDPVYSGKAMAGLLAHVSARKAARDQPVVFLHTGGQPALFAYQGTFAA